MAKNDISDQEKLEAKERVDRGQAPATVDSRDRGKAQVLNKTEQGERDTMKPVYSRDPVVRGEAERVMREAAEVEQKRAQGSDKDVSVTLTGAELVALLQLATSRDFAPLDGDEAGATAVEKLQAKAV